MNTIYPGFKRFMDQSTLGSICNYFSPLTPETSVEAALKLMREAGISSIVVTDGDRRPSGIFTEHDALKVVAEGTAATTPLAEVMTPDVFCVRSAMHLHDAYTLMEERGFRHLIVVDGEGVFAGVVTEGDFLRQMGFEHLAGFKSVAEVMSPSPLTVTPDLSVRETAARMREQRSDYAIILKGTFPSGIVTERDIAQHFNHLTPEKAIGELDYRPIRTIEANTALQEAARMMEEHGVHQIAVVNDHGTIIGMLDRHHVLKAVHGSYFEFLLRVIDQKSASYDALKRSREELSEKTALLDTILNTLPDLVWLKDLEGRFLSCNKMFERVCGAREADIVGKTDFDLVDEKLANFFRENDLKVIETGTMRHDEEYLVFADGSYEGYFDTAKSPLRNQYGEIIGVLGIARDINQRKEYEQRLEALANYDQLTQLPNRVLMLTQLQNSIRSAARYKRQIALLIFDLDRFKDINDSFGHSIGDEILQIVARRFEQRLREGDTVARLGGDEFAVLLENLTHPEDAALYAEEMIETLSLPYRLSNQSEVYLSASTGIVIAPEHTTDAEKLLQFADTALYKAKNERRGTFCYYSDALTETARERIEYENRLRRAVKNGEFELYYQPQVHIGSGRIVGAEALIRWHDPENGTVSPERFIPLAEETGLINPIGEWVLHEACRQAKAWIDAGYRLTMAVNLSPHQFRHQEIPKIVESALKSSGLNADRLELELTESALMQREEEAVLMMHTLRAQGIRLAIDDFGTGYSSLSYLKRFPIDVLKIDRTFIADVPYENDDMALVSAIVAMGKALDYQVLAEGVERIDQLEFLKAEGCTMYQGYFTSPPVPAAAFEALLAGNP